MKKLCAVVFRSKISCGRTYTKQGQEQHNRKEREEKGPISKAIDTQVTGEKNIRPVKAEKSDAFGGNTPEGLSYEL